MTGVETSKYSGMPPAFVAIWKFGGRGALAVDSGTTLTSPCEETFAKVITAFSSGSTTTVAPGAIPVRNITNVHACVPPPSD